MHTHLHSDSLALLAGLLAAQRLINAAPAVSLAVSPAVSVIVSPAVFFSLSLQRGLLEKGTLKGLPILFLVRTLRPGAQPSLAHCSLMML